MSGQTKKESKHEINRKDGSLDWFCYELFEFYLGLLGEKQQEHWIFQEQHMNDNILLHQGAQSCSRL